MTQNKAVILTVTGILAGMALIAAPFILYFLMISWVFSSGDIPHKTDDEMIANFYKHRNEFSQLSEMITKDKELKGIRLDSTDPPRIEEIGISPSRINEYRSLLSKANLPLEFSRLIYKKESVEFVVSVQGLAVSGSSKGYILTTKGPEFTVENLDKYWSADGKSFVAYRHIEGDWYLFFEYDD